MKLCSLLVVAVVSAGGIACGGDDDDDSAKEPSGGEMSSAGAPAGADAPMPLNGCQVSDFADLTGDDAVVQIASEGLKFTPKCLAVAAGQSVRFEGSLTAHPIAPGNPDDDAAGSPENPIVATSSGNSVEFTFDSAGTFPYYCELHAFGAGMGMAGAVWVR